MSLENASGGFTDLDELARDKTLVVARIKSFDPHQVSSQGYESDPVTVDLLICTGRRAGEVVRGMQMRRNGITNTLRRSAPGKDVAGVIQPKTTEKRKDPFVSMDPVTEAQMDEIKVVYKGGAGFDDNSGLANATAAAPAAGSSAPAGDAAPPF